MPIIADLAERLVDLMSSSDHVCLGKHCLCRTIESWPEIQEVFRRLGQRPPIGATDSARDSV